MRAVLFTGDEFLPAGYPRTMSGYNFWYVVSRDIEQSLVLVYTGRISSWKAARRLSL